MALDLRPHDRRIERLFHGGADAPREARQLIRELDGMPLRKSRDAQVIISELVTNAWRHGNRGDNRPILVTINVEPPHLRIEVCDQGSGFDRPPKGSENGGFGLVIVAGLSDAWGVRSTGETCVWALLADPQT